jgi:hypothetical protein
MLEKTRGRQKVGATNGGSHNRRRQRVCLEVAHQIVWLFGTAMSRGAYFTACLHTGAEFECPPVAAEGEKMKTVCLAIVFIVAATSSRAQTGQDLLKLCESKNAVENISCELYISGFVHGMQLCAKSCQITDTDGDVNYHLINDLENRLGTR